MAGRICTSLEAMCISHEASPRHGTICSYWVPLPTVGPQDQSVRSASGKPTSLCFGETTGSPSLSWCMHMRARWHSGPLITYILQGSTYILAEGTWLVGLDVDYGSISGL